MSEYHIIEVVSSDGEKALSGLIKEVNRLSRDNWQPLGGHQSLYVQKSGLWCYSQALIRRGILSGVEGLPQDSASW